MNIFLERGLLFLNFKEFKEKYNYYDAVYCILKDFDYNHCEPDEVFNNIRKALECYCDGDEWFNSLIKASKFLFSQYIRLSFS